MSQGLTIPPELDAEMTPGVRAFVKLLLGRIEQLEAEVADLKKLLEKMRRHRTRIPRRGLPVQQEMQQEVRPLLLERRHPASGADSRGIGDIFES